MRLTPRNILQFIIPTAVFIFFVTTIIRKWGHINQYSFSLDPMPFSLSVVLLVLFVMFSSWSWKKILEELTDTDIPFGDALKIYITSWILRYIPGRVSMVLGKIYLSHQKWGIPKKEILLSSAYEHTFITITSLLIGGYALYLTNTWPKILSSATFVGLFIFLMLPIFFPKLFYSILNFFLAVAKRDPVRFKKKISPYKLFLLLLCYFGNRLLFGIAFLFLTESLIHVKPENIIFISSSFVLAAVIGLLAFFSPGGLGVREGTLVYLLQTIIPLETAIILSLLSRLWQILADSILALIIFIPIKNNEKI